MNFQSHNGLILTSKMAERSIPTAFFQSHNGLILTSKKSISNVLGLVLSIPQWSDFNVISLGADWDVEWLSIPQWSDFNTKEKRD